MMLILYNLYVSTLKTRKSLVPVAVLVKRRPLPAVKMNMRWRNNMAIQQLKSINEQLVDAQLDFAVKKLLYKEKEAKLLLETDFEEVLGKKRPTVDEKKSWLLLQMKEAKHELNHAEVLVEKLKRDYEIEKLNIRFTGDFLTTVATGAGLE
jgi:hypothetical protein